MAASVEFMASLGLSSILAWLPVIGRLRICRRRRRTPLERFLSLYVHMAFEDLKRGCAIVIKLNRYKLCTLMEAARIMSCDSVLEFIEQDNVSKFNQ